MLKRTLFALPLLALTMGGSCSITISPGDDTGGSGTTQTTLDQATAVIAITHAVGDPNASVSATIKDSHNRTVTLRGDQAVEVNDVELAGPNSSGRYAALVDPAAQYTVRVHEPTIGVQSTMLDGPADFEVVSPTDNGTVSLSGFTLLWSNPNEQHEVTIELSQTVYGSPLAKTYGPFGDSGTHTFTASDLSSFVHGTNLTLTIELTKTASTSTVNGFKSGTMTAQVTATRTAVPRP